MSRELRKYDVRTIDRLLREKKVNEEEYEKYLASLPDAAEKAVPMESEFVQGILDEEEGDSDED